MAVDGLGNLTHGGGMSDNTIRPEAPKTDEAPKALKPERDRKPAWETPKLEDVSEQVMAQPYIRFT